VVARGAVVAGVNATGTVVADNASKVGFRGSGRVADVFVKVGDQVRVGQPLAQLDTGDLHAQLLQAQAAQAQAEAKLQTVLNGARPEDLDIAQAQLAQAQANYIGAQRQADRMMAIQKQNAQLVSAAELDNLRTQADVNRALVEAARHGVDQAEAALENAQSSLAKTTIVAPMGGRVTRLAVEQGETAVPGTFNKEAALLLTISDMGALETKVRVDETDVARIAVGDSALVEIDAFPDTAFRGRVAEISSSALREAAAAAAGGGGGGEQAVDYEVRVELLDAPPDTRPDFSATARIVTETRRRALSIPIIALTVREHEAGPGGDSAPVALGRRPAGAAGARDVEGVFVVGPDHRVAFRPVRVGIAGEEYFEVLSGLREGETVVAGSYQAIRELKEGALVREAKRERGAKAKAEAARRGARA
jgi:HlyD family secretion protein